MPAEVVAITLSCCSRYTAPLPPVPVPLLPACLPACCLPAAHLQMKVDVSRRELLHVTFNLTFPALPCEAVLMDAGDVSGKWQTESRISLARWAGEKGGP